MGEAIHHLYPPLFFHTFGCKAQKSFPGLESPRKYSCFWKEQDDARATALAFWGSSRTPRLVKLAQTSTFTAVFRSSIVTASILVGKSSLWKVLSHLKFYENLCKSRSRQSQNVKHLCQTSVPIQNVLPHPFFPLLVASWDGKEKEI